VTSVVDVTVRRAEATTPAIESGRRYTQLRLAYLDGNEGARRFCAQHWFVEREREDGSGGLLDSVWMER